MRNRQIQKNRLTILASSKLHGVAPGVTGLRCDGYKNGYIITVFHR